MSVHSLAQRVLSHIRRQELLHAGDRVGIAVSGGIDSVALLRLMLELRGELGIVLSVAHFNHNLREAESDADEQFVAALAREHDLEFFVDRDDVARAAAEDRVSLEAAARDLRYGFFRSLLGEEGEPQGLKPASPSAPDGTAGSRAPSSPNRRSLNKIATGHTLDDQAETVLMRMIRGAGTGGLGAIYPRIAVEDDDGEVCGEIVRPMLTVRRRELRQYLLDIRQDWREDSTNADDAFTRNRVRKLLVPLLEKEFNPNVAENLAELAEIARGEEDYWENEVAGWMGTAVHWSEPEWARTLPSDGLVQIAAAARQPESQSTRFSQNRGQVGHRARNDQDLRSKIDAVPWLVMNAAVDRLWFLGEPVAVQRRVVKAIGEQARIPLEFKHVEEILSLAAEEKGLNKAVSLPRRWKVLCTADEIVFHTPDLRESAEPQDYEYEISLPGEVTIDETGTTIEAREVPTGELERYNSDRQFAEQLLDAQSVRGPLRVRNWHAGDRFWPAHTKSPRKIKELLQQRHIPLADRKLWPVVESGDEIIWMRGFAVPAKLLAKKGQPAVLIQEKPLVESAST